jgi:hypothetical protein
LRADRFQIVRQFEFCAASRAAFEHVGGDARESRLVARLEIRTGAQTAANRDGRRRVIFKNQDDSARRQLRACDARGEV